MQRLLARASQKPFTLTTQALIPVISSDALGGDADQYVNYYLPGNGNGWAFALHYPLVRDEQPHAASRIVRSLEPFPGFLRSVLN